MCGSVRPSFLAWLLKSTHSLGQSDKLGHVVAEGNGRDLRKHVEKSVAVGVDEVVASRLGVVADQDVGARVLDLVDLGRLHRCQLELWDSKSVEHVQQPCWQDRGQQR
jgi:hypothetical protein